MKGYGDALAVIAAAMAQAVTPPSSSTPDAWASENLIEVVGPRAGQPWDPAETPQIAAIIRLLAPGQPFTEIAVRKSAQVGFTRGLEAWAGFIACEDPAPALFVMPTIGLAQDFNKDKLQPTIEASPALRKRISRASRRDMLGSSALSKRFPGGSLTLTGANSAATLRSRTVKFAICDEIDEWPSDLEGQGDPMSMVDARMISYHATRQHKKVMGSTPTIAGSSASTGSSRRARGSSGPSPARSAATTCASNGATCGMSRRSRTTPTTSRHVAAASSSTGRSGNASPKAGLSPSGLRPA